MKDVSLGVSEISICVTAAVFEIRMSGFEMEMHS